MLFGKRERLIRKILVVEDEPLVAFDIEHILDEAGYEVAATVNSLADARAVIEARPLDLVLTDLKLSGKGDGTGVARIARAKGIPVLFITAFDAGDAKGLCVGCLAKPYSERVLKTALDALDNHLQGRASKKVPPQLTLYADTSSPI